MLTDNRAQYRPQDWYLIACDGDLVLKLARNLMIGEDASGQTVLSPAREDALLRISSDGGRLTLQAMAMDWTFSEDGGLSVQHLTFIEGLSLRLNFPNSSLLITPDFVAGREVPIDRDIELRPTRTPTLTLTRVDEPISLIEPAFLPLPPAKRAKRAKRAEPAEPDAAARSPDDSADELDMDEVAALLEAANESSADAAFLDWDHDVPDETLADAAVASQPAAAPAERSASKVITAHPAAPDRVAQHARSITPDLPGHEKMSAILAAGSEEQASRAEGRSFSAPAVIVERSKVPARVFSAVVAVIALLAPMALLFVESQKLGVDFPLTNYRSAANTAATSSWPEESRPQAQVPVEPAPLRPATLNERPGIQQEPPLAPPLTESEKLLVASLLAEAKAYYDAGAIITPAEGNAVGNLTQLLHIDPTHEAGLGLMYQSAVRLTEEAQAAHAAGNEFLARNLAEEVLGFHPEFEAARALLDSWTRTP